MITYDEVINNIKLGYYQLDRNPDDPDPRRRDFKADLFELYSVQDNERAELLWHLIRCRIPHSAFRSILILFGQNVEIIR